MISSPDPARFIVYKRPTIVDNPQFGGLEWQKAHLGILTKAQAEDFEAMLHKGKHKGTLNTKIEVVKGKKKK